METENINRTLLIVLYVLSIFFLYPIIRYWVAYTLGFFPNAEDSLILIRVFLSGPILVIIGGILIKGFKKHHKITGAVFFTIGILWLVQVIATVINEAA